MAVARGTTKACIYNFWQYVKDANPDDMDSCWEWTGAFDGSGYPMYCGVAARRIAALIDTGKIPGNVSMDCNNIKCVRPAHIFRIGNPGRKTSKGVIPARYDIEFQRKIYELRSLTDGELMTKFAVNAQTLKACRYSTALYAIEAEVLFYKNAGKPIPIRQPLAATLELE